MGSLSSRARSHQASGQMSGGKEEGKTTFEKGGLARKNLMQMPTEFDNDAFRSIFLNIFYAGSPDKDILPLKV